jgi:recombination associated protein RdgC
LGVLQGSVSYARFFVRGSCSARLRASLLERIRLRRFEPLNIDDEVDERAGWCSIEHPLDLDLTQDKVMWGGYVNLGLRVDRWRIPKPVFKAQLAEAEIACLARKGKEKLSRAEKEELKFTVKRRLRKQVIPSMRVTDLSWDLDRGILRVFSHSQKVHAYVEELFKLSFDLDVVVENPFTAAVHLGLSDAQASRLTELVREPFVGDA